MTLSIPREYHDREQTYLKHRVLREYLRAWVQKLGSLAQQGPLTIYYVDCFAGPWRSADQKHADTSVAIGLVALAEAVGAWRESALRAHAVFVEAQPQSAEQLREYVAKHTRAGMTAEVIEGTFEDHALRISTLIGNNPAFIFVDPTGWKGVGMKAVAGVARGSRRDVMVNVMYDHLNRFKDDERAFLRQQMLEFFGLDLEHGLSENDLMGRYRDQLRDHGRLQFVADLAVPHPTRRRTYFRLVLGSGHRKALELFRNVEHKVCGREAATVRDDARKRAEEEDTGQIQFELAAPKLDVDYAQAREQDLQASRETLVQILRQKGSMTFDELWPIVLERHHVRLVDIKSMVKDLSGTELDWRRSKGPTQRVVQGQDLLSTLARGH